MRRRPCISDFGSNRPAGTKTWINQTIGSKPRQRRTIIAEMLRLATPAAPMSGRAIPDPRKSPFRSRAARENDRYPRCAGETGHRPCALPLRQTAPHRHDRDGADRSEMARNADIIILHKPARRPWKTIERTGEQPGALGYNANLRRKANSARSPSSHGRNITCSLSATLLKPQPSTPNYADSGIRPRLPRKRKITTLPSMPWRGSRSSPRTIRTHTSPWPWNSRPPVATRSRSPPSAGRFLLSRTTRAAISRSKRAQIHRSFQQGDRFL